MDHSLPLHAFLGSLDVSFHQCFFLPGFFPFQFCRVGFWVCWLLVFLGHKTTSWKDWGERTMLAAAWVLCVYECIEAKPCSMCVPMCQNPRGHSWSKRWGHDGCFLEFTHLTPALAFPALLGLSSIPTVFPLSVVAGGRSGCGAACARPPLRSCLPVVHADYYECHHLVRHVDIIIFS